MNYKFSSDLIYTSRKTKADYIFDKYRDILVESVIDVGADQLDWNDSMKSLNEKISIIIDKMMIEGYAGDI